MRKMLIVIGIVAIATVFVLTAQAQPAGNDEGGLGAGQGRGHGQHGKLGRGGQQGIGFGQEGQPGKMGGMGRGYIETNETTRQLWTQLGELQSQLHEARWQLFEVLNKQPVDRDAVKAQAAKMKDIATQVRDINQQLEPYRKQFERPERPAPNQEGGQANEPA